MSKHKGDLSRISSKRRRALKRKIYVRDQGKCQICFKTLTHDEATLDHYPIKKRDGGSNKMNNLRLACLPCNWEIDGLPPPKENL